MISDADIVRRIAAWIAAETTDHMLGLRVRLLFEDRAERGAEVRPADAESRGWMEFDGGAVVDLLDGAGPYDPRD